MGKTAGVPHLLQQGMPLSAAAYSSVLQMREGHLLEIVLSAQITHRRRSVEDYACSGCSAGISRLIPAYLDLFPLIEYYSFYQPSTIHSTSRTPSLFLSIVHIQICIPVDNNYLDSVRRRVDLSVPFPGGRLTQAWQQRRRRTADGCPIRSYAAKVYLPASGSDESATTHGAQQATPSRSGAPAEQLR
jgi:hypothetical protein